MMDNYQDQLQLRGMDPLHGKKIYVRKRDARIEEFNEARICLAIESAFKAVEGIGRDATLPGPLQAAVKKCADAVVEKMIGRAVRGQELEVEQIQDAVEEQLMLDGHLAVARRYILYREKRRQARADRENRPSPFPAAFSVKGKTLVVPPVVVPPHAGAPIPAPAAVPVPIRIEPPPSAPIEPLLEKIYSQTLAGRRPDEERDAAHRRYFSIYVNEAQYLRLLAPEMLDFDLDQLAGALRLERDALFPAAGLKALHDGCLLADNGRLIETPQYFWMRIAMGLALNEGGQCESRALDFYEALSTFRFVPSEAILCHAGATQPQLLNCFSATSLGDVEHVTARPGPRPKARPKTGLTCSWLEPWHIGIRDFLKRPGPDASPWNQDLNKALWVPDLFMKRVAGQGQWTLFNPAEVPGLHRQFGRAFEKLYIECEEKVDRGEIREFHRINAADLWLEILASLADTGQPWLGFKDAANARATIAHEGGVRNGSLCTAILLNTAPQELSACAVGSINLAAHFTADSPATLDVPRLRATIATAIRMLDNALDLAGNTGSMVREFRPVALGILGFQDALDRLGINYASAAAADFAERSMELVSHAAILASAALARERGAFPAYAGSKWSEGLLPIDTLALLANERGATIDIDASMTLDWDVVREAIRRDGVRHSTITAISTTDTGSMITGASPSIEPCQRNAFAIGPQWLIECAARRQKWLDMGQSLGIYAANLDLAALADVYMQAWEKGLKATRQLHLRTDVPPPDNALRASAAAETEPVAVK